MEVRGPRETPSPAVRWPRWPRGRVSAPHRAGWSGPPRPLLISRDSIIFPATPLPCQGTVQVQHPLGTCGGEPGHSQHLPGTQGPQGNRPLSFSGGTPRGGDARFGESTARLRDGFGLREGNWLSSACSEWNPLILSSVSVQTHPPPGPLALDYVCTHMPSWVLLIPQKV